ncbi:MAG TPA: hypothetical protein VGR02_16905 [Thermoanaerobaculia bacterium]|jgi:hypothetical protein|nr:hypothetical protein [Thermoanaerobaculia bacterium]
MSSHVDILGILYIILGILGVAVGVCLFVVIFGAGAISGERDAALVTGAVGTFVAAIVIVLSAPSIIVGIGLRRRREWARVFALILAALHLLSFPLGTAVGIYAFWVLLNPEAARLFASQTEIPGPGLP